MLSLFPPTGSVYAEPLLKRLDEILDESLQLLRQETATRVLPYEVVVDYEYEEETHEAGQERRATLLHDQHERDICRTSDFRAVLKDRMGRLATATGPAYQDIISTVEPITLKQLDEAVR